MSELLRSPLADTVGWSLVHHLWQGTLLALVAAVLLGLMRKQSANSREAIHPQAPEWRRKEES